MMSDYSYELDGGYGEEPPQRDVGPGPMYRRRFFNSGGYNMEDQYNEAFGDYRGGYGPGDGFRPQRPRPYPPGPVMGRGMGGGMGRGMGGGMGRGMGGGMGGGMGRGMGRGMGGGMGRGFGPMGPGPRGRGPRHPAIKMLMDCGVAKEQLKNLPVPLLDMMMPESCGICSQNFDTFAIAKIHYNCKNHAKAQKKFLSQPVHGPAGINEVPIKARNLYCELCDVHITSVAHADSHYAGKSHRAIVEGRKPAKNPTLLQPGMETRVQQLIRREKRANPGKSEAETETVDKPKPPAPEKVVSPELMCEICKTSVTNSEQMTMHLNGKRHLTKEKQHILKMMKGEADKKKDEENGGGEDVTANGAGEGTDVDAAAAVETAPIDTDAGDAAVAGGADDWGTGADAAATWDDKQDFTENTEI